MRYFWFTRFFSARGPAPYRLFVWWKGVDRNETENCAQGYAILYLHSMAFGRELQVLLHYASQSALNVY